MNNIYLWDNEKKEEVLVYAKTVGKQMMALCPWHCDKNPSLSISLDKGEYHCFGCGKKGKVYDETMRKSKRKPLKKEHREFLEKRGHHYSDSTIDKYYIHSSSNYIRYNYQGYSRYINTKSKNPKWMSNKGSTARLIGDLDANPIYLMEGEHDMFLADKLSLKGCLTYTAGCQSVPKKIELEKFKDKDVVIIYDVDRAGNSGSLKLCEALVNLCKTVKNVRLPITPDKGKDFTDWISNGGTIEELKRIVDETEEYEVGRVFQAEGCCIWEQDGAYMKQTKEAMITISNFVFRPKKVIVLDKYPFYRVDIKTTETEVVEDVDCPPETWESRKSLLKVIRKSKSARFKGGDTDAMDIKGLCSARKVPEYTGTDVIGFHFHGGRALWVLDGITLDENGVVEDSKLLYISDNVSPLPANVKYKSLSDDEFKKLSNTLKENLEKINLPEVSLPVLGWFFSNPFKPKIMEVQGHYALLNCWGTKGSGKTSTLRMFNNLFGLMRKELFSATDTEFYMLKLLNSTNSIPVVFDEYRPWDMRGDALKRFKHYAIAAYDGQTKGRGKPDQSLVLYTIKAPMAVAGESRLSEKAHLDRCVIINFNPRTLKMGNYKEHFKALEEMDLSGFAERYIRWTLKTDFRIYYQQAKQLVNEFLKSDDVLDRWVDNTIVWVFGYLCYTNFFGVELDVNGLIKAINVMIEELQEDGKGRTALEGMLEVLAVMAGRGRLKPSVDYFIYYDKITEKKKLLIKMKHCIPEFKKYARETAFDGEVLDRSAYNKQMKERKGIYVDDVGGWKNIDRNTEYGTIIDVESAEKTIDISGFDTGWNNIDYHPKYR